MQNSRLLKLKSKKGLFDTNVQTIVLDTLVVGDSISCFKQLFSELSKSGNVNILLSNDLPLDRLVQDWKYSFTYFRGEEVNDYFQKNHPGIEISSFSEDPLFYKDQTLKPFGGRARPFKMLDFESYFIEKPLVFDMDKFFPESDLNAIKDKCLVEALHSITFGDGVWTLVCKNGVTIKTQNLLWGEGRKKFFQLIDDDFKATLSEDELNIFSSVEEYSLINVTFDLKKSMTKGAQTVFIPQSQTHEWGHFILDFHQADSNGAQKVIGHIFLYSDDEDEEALGKKIRLMKRNTDKVFEGFKENIIDEKILFLDQFWCHFQKHDNIESSSKLPLFISSQALLGEEKYNLMKVPFVANLLN